MNSQSVANVDISHSQNSSEFIGNDLNLSNHRSRSRLRETLEERLINAERRRIQATERVRRYRRSERNINNQRLLEQNRNILQNENLNEHYLGEMNVLCKHCNVTNKDNSFSDCCGLGSVELESIPEFPVELRLLFENHHVRSGAFFERIRNYNSSFSFASFNANLVNFPIVGRAPYCFKIQGQVYYQINEALYPSENENPQYGQLFIVHFQEAVDYRMASNLGTDREIVNNLEEMLREYNIFA